MLLLTTFWWLAFFTVLGLCIGSFLNVVVYRLPHGQSLSQPRFSACPACAAPIRWHDNLPVLSYLLLRGRCRDCAAPISPRYPIIELLMALVTMLIFGAFFIAPGGVAGFASPASLLAWQLGRDWPTFAAHVILFAALLAMSVIDLEHYWVDIRFTHLATLAGFVLHAIWTPSTSRAWIRPWDSTAVVCLAALVGLAAVHLVGHVMYRSELAETDPSADDAPGPPPDDSAGVMRAAAHVLGPADAGLGPQDSAPHAGARWRGLIAAGILGVMLFSTDLAALLESFSIKGTAFYSLNGLLAIGAIFTLILGASVVERASDHEIFAAIEAERFSARRVAVEELLRLAPAIMAGLLGLALVHGWHRAPPLSTYEVAAVIHWSPTGDWRPVWGLATATAGFIIGGAIGWVVRIFFTLVLGKEAYGVGDIHMMAAAGCVAGWPVVLLGFFAAVFLALLAWLLTLPFKRTRAIPLGPWLSLGFLIVALFYDSIVSSRLIAGLLAPANLLLFGHD